MNEETNIIKKDESRLKILQKIDEFEKKEWWSKDVEDDPPTIPLTPDKVDYLNEKFINKLLSFFINIKAYKFIENLISKKQLIIKEIKGIENFETLLNQGFIITCNHFNAFDNFAIHYMVHPYIGTKLYKIIREGNFTNFPGLYGLFFRHCNTLPLSSNFSTMKKFLSAIKVLLNRGEKILIYPEQGMWWNYRKPRPLTNGAFKFAVDNNVPILPVFITMNDSELIGSDGFFIQEYTINVLSPIYPDANKSNKENIEYMKKLNYEKWVQCYEDFYKIPLVYNK